MSLNFSKINNVSPETKSAISRKSAQTLPNNPSERGYSAEEIKRRFYQPILDAANSALAEIDRVVNEANLSFSQVSDELDNFIDSTKITEAYKVELDNTSWTLNEETQMYELVVTKEEHNIQDYKEIGVNMFLLDGDGKYTQVNQFEVGIDGSVRCFHETNGAGYLSIYVKREGFIVGNTIVDADHVVGLAKVGRTNSFNDLDDQPDLEPMKANSILISKIASGEQKVGSAIYAQESGTSTYAKTSGSAESCDRASTAKTAMSDMDGVDFVTGYARNIGDYPDMSVGKAKLADRALRQVSFNMVDVRATISVRGNGSSTESTCIVIDLVGYGMLIPAASDEYLPYWIGNLYSTDFYGVKDLDFTSIEDISLEFSYGFDNIVSGGVCKIKQYDHECYSFYGDNVSGVTTHYAPLDHKPAWSVAQTSKIVITNFIARRV